MNMKRFALFIFLLSVATAQAQPEKPQIPQVTVSGSAEVRVAPDEILIHAGVEIRNDNLDQARQQNDERMKKVLSFLKNSGVSGKDVQTDFINIAPDYDRLRASKVQTYIVRKFIEVRLTNTSNLETILTGMLDAGVDRINNVEFRTTQLRKYRDQARAMAIKAAREKADALCAELQVKRGKPLNINASESAGYWNPYASMGYNVAANNVQNMAQDPGTSSDSPNQTLSLGQVSVSATVNVSFQIE
jgi:uncharacterized protein YggE